MNDRQQLVALMGFFALLLVGELVYGYFCWSEKSGLEQTLEGLKNDETSLQAKLGQIGSLRDDFSSCTTPGSCLVFCNGVLADDEACTLDNAGSGATIGLCKLPAQVRAEGGTCTAP